MKYFMILSFVFSTSAFAIGMNDVTGTFSLPDTPKEYQPEPETTFLSGTFEVSDKARLPAGVEAEKKDMETNVTDLTGTF